MSNDERSTARPPPGTTEGEGKKPLIIHVLNEYDDFFAKRVGLMLAMKTFRGGTVLVDFCTDITPQRKVESDLAIVAVNEFTDLDEILLRTHIMCDGARIIVHNTAPSEIDESPLYDNQVFGLFQQHDFQVLFALIEELLQLKNSSRIGSG